MNRRICGTSAGVAGRRLSISFSLGEGWVIAVLSKCSRFGCGVGRLVGRFVGGLLAGLRGEPFVEGNIEVEELLLVAGFVRKRVDHLNEELGAFERVFVELTDIVEEIAGEGA